MKKQSRGKALVLFLAPLVYLAAAILVVAVVCRNGRYPSGADTMYHIYRGDWLYRSIEAGNPWPLVDPAWYNGVELLRYWPPLAAYFMAFCKLLAGGNALYGYLIFVGLICFLGALPWLYMGCKRDRPIMGAFLGLLWFFMPNNLYAMFIEGNLARSVSMIFLPLLLFHVYSYLGSPSWKTLLWITVTFALVTLCHLGYGGMTALGILLYLLIDKLVTRRKRGALCIFAAILLGFLVLGVWLAPSLIGGITKMDTSEVMERFFQSAWISLNPLERYESGNGNFYFGLAAFLLAVFGIFFSRRETIPGFVAGIVILACTTTSMYPVMKMLPGSQYLWMLRFISIALCMILMSWFFWKDLRGWISVVLAALLVLDVIPSLGLLYRRREPLAQSADSNVVETVQKRMDDRHETILVKRAQEITRQRIAQVDLSMLPNAAWHIVDWGEPKLTTNGAGWEASNTGANISQLERALLEGNYLYLFDRAIQLGCDTVLLYKGAVDDAGDPQREVDSAATLAGYSFVEGNENALLYHRETPEVWGTVTKYRGIAIGDVTVNGLCRSFPAMKEGDSTNLNDYTYEELSEYQLIYLTNFTYDDKVKAENMLLKLSEHGVRVVISADGVPESRETRDRSFLGVVCNPISFENGYPELDTLDGVLSTDLFPADHTDWSTVYVEGLDEVWGAVEEPDGVRLSFYGTVKNDNIVFVGLNLTYFLSLTGDRQVESLLSRAMALSPEELPEREIVPLSVAYGKNVITIQSPEDNVNTSLAYHGDVFSADREIRMENNLTLVDKGTTVITLRYPHFYLGLAVNIAGKLLTALFLAHLRKREKEEKKEEEP